MRSCNLLPRSSRFISKSQRSSLSSPLVRLQKSRSSPSSASAFLRRQAGSKAPSTRLTRKQLCTASTDNATPPVEGQTESEKNVPSGATGPSGSAPEEPPEEEGVASEPPPPSEEPEKAKTRRTRLSAAPKDIPDPIALPDELNILFDPLTSDQPIPGPSALPPPDIFERALHNLHVTLHPHTQHQATYPSASTSRVEPTLALYCPIEGGDYIIDATVRELARSTNAEVVILDSVHLAAGECGMFGKAGSAVQLPVNPLHFTGNQPSPAPSSRRPSREESEQLEDAGPFMGPSQMTVTVMTPGPQGRTLLTKRTIPPSKLRLFFDSVIDIKQSSNNSSETSTTTSSSTSTRRPRLIYIRDFTTLASSSSIWYPHLLAAVRQRRKGSTSRPSSTVPNPTTIVFGMTPPLISPYSQQTPQLPPSPRPPASRGSSSRGSAPRYPSHDWGEDEHAVKARESRLRDRLRKWERGDRTLQDEIPCLAESDVSEEEMGDPRPDVLVVPGPGGLMGSTSGLFGMPPRLPSFFTNSSSPSGNDSQFFRTSVLLPETRSTDDELACRIGRRREINELTIRMAISAIGGTVEDATLGSLVSEDPAVPESEVKEPQAQDGPKESLSVIWDDWGKRLEAWTSVRQIADSAMGNVISSLGNSWYTEASTSLQPTTVPWSAVQWAWINHRAKRKVKRHCLKEFNLGEKIGMEEEEEASSAEAPEEVLDEVIERVKQDPDLEPHEQRLLPCIVNAASMQTNFAQVHLPPHTIDSVRTIVSLPLLHPAVFQQGILKDHAMTGCLLFGPPGTGKTLLVKALAKEAGCRMMTISPSDVMDMYVGEGEKLVKAVFSLARRLSPCVVFLDEIDALFGARMSSRESGGAFAHRGVITEFMQEMDGLKSSKDDNVIVIGATNRPFDLDDAVLRRLPRRLLVDLPGEAERAEILKIMLRDEVLSPSVDIQRLARETSSFSGSDLKHLCVSAALDAVKERVTIPWATTSRPDTDSSKEGAEATSTATASAATPASSEPASSETPAPDAPQEPSSPEGEASSTEFSNTFPRILRPHNFNKALKEITPTASESLSALVRKWNDEFGEGRKDRKKQQVWGKGIFGFIDKSKTEDNGRILPENPASPGEIRR